MLVQAAQPNRHSGEGRNPVNRKIRVADKATVQSRFARNFLFYWIPAFAGMTVLGWAHG